MLKRISGLIVAVTLMGGCTANKYCLDEQDYYTAGSVPPLAGAEGLKVPSSPTALRVPPEPANPVPYGEKVTDAEGRERAKCLDVPPALPPMVEPAAEPEAEAKS